MYAKMSVFHWHITDTDSFPLELTKIPDITKFGAFSEDEIYHVEEIKEFLHYAAMRGVRVIPEIDMPAHTLSWGFSPEYKEIIACGGDGVINPTMQKTKNVLDAIWGEIMEVFKDEYVHFGFDEVPLDCWGPVVQDLINKAKAANTTAEFIDTKDLAIAFKASLKERTPGKKHMVWYRGGEQVPFGEDEVLQFWDGANGVTSAMDQRPNNTFVVSPLDTFYLDCGVGNAFGDGSWCGGWHGWRTMYDFDPFQRFDHKHQNQLLGAEGTLWSERANADVLEARIWPRLLSLSERFWSNFTDAETGVNQNHFMYLRIQEMINRMRFKGIKSEPITSGLCEREGNCF
jgi:hexosaminidase